MKASTVTTAFKALRTDYLPDIHELNDERQVLWVLAAAKAEPSLKDLTSAQIADILQDVFGVGISRQRVTAILSKSRAFLVTNKRQGVKYFKIMKLGEDALRGSTLEPIHVDRDKPFTSIRRVEDALGAIDGEVRICDPYISPGTLDYVGRIARATAIRLLTENVQDSTRLRRDLQAFNKEHPVAAEIRVLTPGHLHDRYILHDRGMLSVGASLKDIGKKQSLVIPISAELAREVARVFEKDWNRATKFV